MGVYTSCGATNCVGLPIIPLRSPERVGTIEVYGLPFAWSPIGCAPFIWNALYWECLGSSVGNVFADIQDVTGLGGLLLNDGLRDVSGSLFGVTSRLEELAGVLSVLSVPGRLTCDHPQARPLLRQRLHIGLSLLHLTLAMKQELHDFRCRGVRVLVADIVLSCCLAMVEAVLSRETIGGGSSPTQVPRRYELTI